MFRYRLQPLLRYRKILEEEQQRVLAMANRELMAEINLGKELESSRREAMKWKMEIYKTAPDSKHLVMYDNYITGLDSDIARNGERKRLAQLKADLEREKLIELVKKRRTIELHRDRLEERFNEEEARKERIQADEIATMRFVRAEKRYV